MNYVIEGIDRLGKSTLVENIIKNLGFHQVLKYSKPPKGFTAHNGISLNYQLYSFMHGFGLLGQFDNLIFDRFHLGEVVYSPLYRGYDGTYVYELEKCLVRGSQQWKNTRLVWLYTSNFDILVDDGKSLDWSKKEEEQDRFGDAFDRSELNKVQIDVAGPSGYRNAMDIFRQATEPQY